MIFAPAPERYDQEEQRRHRTVLAQQIATAAQSYGTYTPTITSSGGGETLTYTNQGGQWVRQGSMIWFAADITLATKSGGSGDIQVSLPADIHGNLTGAVASYVDAMAAGWTGAPLATATAGGRLVRIRELAAGAAAAAWGKLGATAVIRVTGSYLAAQ